MRSQGQGRGPKGEGQGQENQWVVESGERGVNSHGARVRKQYAAHGSPFWKLKIQSEKCKTTDKNLKCSGRACSALGE